METLGSEKGQRQRKRGDYNRHTFTETNRPKQTQSPKRADNNTFMHRDVQIPINIFIDYLSINTCTEEGQERSWSF